MSPLVRLAQDLDYDLKPGSKHWKARHRATGYLTTVPYGTRMSPRSERNVRASLKRGTKGGLP